MQSGSFIDGDPFVWIVDRGDDVVDARILPLEEQRRLAAAGMIPYVPHDRLLERLGEAVPLNVSLFPGARARLEEMGVGLPSDGASLLALDAIDGGDAEGIVLLIALSQRIPLTWLRVEPTDPLAAAIEEYRVIRARRSEPPSTPTDSEPR